MPSSVKGSALYKPAKGHGLGKPGAHSRAGLIARPAQDQSRQKNKHADHQR